MWYSHKTWHIVREIQQQNEIVYQICAALSTRKHSWIQVFLFNSLPMTKVQMLKYGLSTQGMESHFWNLVPECSFPTYCTIILSHYSFNSLNSFKAGSLSSATFSVVLHIWSVLNITWGNEYIFSLQFIFMKSWMKRKRSLDTVERERENGIT